MSVIVFLGPSLPVADAHRIFAADYRPPVALGDMYRATLEHPACIAIIDGVFHHQPAVWHKEILFALAQGIAVVGSSSMGALRAVEMAPFGMSGVGRVFEIYRRGVVDADDEVAVVHGDENAQYRCSSVALVNIRFAVEDLRELGLLADAEASNLISAVKRLHYSDRSWPRVLTWLDASIGSDRAATIATWLADRRPDQKREDARQLLERLAAGEFRGDPSPRMPFERTYHWDRMLLEEDPAYSAETA